ATHTLTLLFFFNDPAPTEIYTLSLHDALPISEPAERRGQGRHRRHRLRVPEVHARPLQRGRSLERLSGGDERSVRRREEVRPRRSEEHTSELQSPCNLVCRLLLEKKKIKR